eukprot:gene30441-38049_t
MGVPPKSPSVSKGSGDINPRDKRARWKGPASQEASTSGGTTHWLCEEDIEDLAALGISDYDSAKKLLNTEVAKRNNKPRAKQGAEAKKLKGFIPVGFTVQ